MLSGKQWETIFDYLSEKDLENFKNVSRIAYELVVQYFIENQQHYTTNYFALLDYYEQRLNRLPNKDGTIAMDEACLAIGIGLLKLHPFAYFKQGEALKRLLGLMKINLNRFLPERVWVLKEYINRLRSIFPVTHACWSVTEIEQLLEDIEQQIYSPAMVEFPLLVVNSPSTPPKKQSVPFVLEKLRFNQEKIYKYAENEVKKQEYRHAHTLILSLYIQTLLEGAGGNAVKERFWQSLWSLPFDAMESHQKQRELLRQWIERLGDYEQHDHALLFLKEIIERCARDKPNLRIINRALMDFALHVERHRNQRDRLSIAEQLQKQLKNKRKPLEEKIHSLSFHHATWTSEIFSLEQQWNQVLQKLTADLLETAYQFLGLPPQSFIIFAIGSFSLSGATPYSDVEYGVLLQQAENEISRNYIIAFLECFHVLVELLGEHSMPHVGFHMDIGMHPVPMLGGEERLKGTIDTMTAALTSKNYTLKDTINNALQHPRVLFEANAKDDENTTSFKLFKEFKDAIKVRAAQSYPGFEGQLNWREARALAHLQGMFEEAKNGNKKGKKGWLFVDTEIIPPRVNIKSAYALIKYWLMDRANFAGLTYGTVKEALQQLAINQLHPEFVAEIEYTLAAFTLLRYRAQFKAGQQRGQEWICASTSTEKEVEDYVLNPEEERAWREAYLTVIQPCYLLLEVWGLEQCDWKINAANKDETAKVIEQFKQMNQVDPIVILLKDLIKRFSNPTQFATITTTASTLTLTTTTATTTSTSTTPITTTTMKFSPQDKRMIQSIAAIQQSRWQREKQLSEKSWMERHFKTYQRLPAILQKEYELSLQQIIDINSPSKNWVAQLKVWQYLQNPHPNLSKELQHALNNYLLHCLEQNIFHPERYWDKLPFEVQKNLIEIFEVARIPFNTLYNLKYRLQPNGESYERQFEQREWEKSLKKIFITENEYQVEKLTSPEVNKFPMIEIRCYDLTKGIQEKEKKQKRILHPNVIRLLKAEKILSDQGELASPKETKHGRHHVVAIQVTIKGKKYKLHIKFNPERSGGELMSNRLSWRLGCRAPWVEIMAWVTPKGETIPILVMETIGDGKNMLEEIEENLNQDYEAEWTAQISNASWTRQILRTVIVSQSDGKVDNYVREQQEYAQGQFEYRWVPIDNERALWPYRVYLPNQSWLPLCQDIHFVLKDFHTRKLDVTVLAGFCQLNPEELFKTWLEELAVADVAFATLFPKAYAKPPAAPKGELDKTLGQLFAVQTKLPLLLAIPLLQESLKILVKRFTGLQNFIQQSKDKQKAITGMECLKVIEPIFAAYLQHLPPGTLQERFHQLFQWGYSQGKTMPFSQLTYQAGEEDLLQQEYSFHKDFATYRLRIGAHHDNHYLKAFYAWKESLETRHQNEIWVIKKADTYTAYILTAHGEWLSTKEQINETLPLLVSQVLKRPFVPESNYEFILTSNERDEVFYWLCAKLGYTRLMAWQKTLLQSKENTSFQQLIENLQTQERQLTLVYQQMIQAWRVDYSKNWRNLEWNNFASSQILIDLLLNTQNSVQGLYLKGLSNLTLETLWKLLEKHPLVHTLDISNAQDLNLAERLFQSPNILQSGKGILQSSGLMRIDASSLSATKPYNLIIIQIPNKGTAFLGIHYLDLSHCPQLTGLECDLPQLQVLKLTDNIALKTLNIRNSVKLKRLNLSRCEALVKGWTAETTSHYIKAHTELAQFRLPNRILLFQYLTRVAYYLQITMNIDRFKTYQFVQNLFYTNQEPSLSLLDQEQLKQILTIESMFNVFQDQSFNKILLKDLPTYASLWIANLKILDKHLEQRLNYLKTLVKINPSTERLLILVFTTVAKEFEDIHIRLEAVKGLLSHCKNLSEEKEACEAIELACIACMDKSIDFFKRNGVIALFEKLVEKNPASEQALILMLTTMAVEQGNIEVVQYLCAQGVIYHPKKSYNRTPLMAAAEQGETAMVQWLCEQGAVVEAKDKEGFTALLCAVSAWRENLKTVKYLVETARANVMVENKNGDTALSLAACNGHIEVVQYLQSKGGDIHHPRKLDNQTPLMVAAGNGKTDMVEWLCEQGVKVEAQDNAGFTALIYSALNWWRHKDTVKYLIEVQHANIEAESVWGTTSLMYAARKGYTKLVKYLHSKGANLHHQNMDGFTALQRAAANNHFDTVNCLLNLGANAIAQKDACYTELHFAAAFRPENLPSLLEVNSNIHEALCAKDVEGNTPIHYAAGFGFLERLKLLLEKLEDKNIISTKNNRGYTPTHLAVCRDKATEIVACLLANGADIDSCDNKGNTVLHKAVEYSREVKILRLLLDAGISVHCKNTRGETPVDIAEKLNETKIIKFLKNYTYAMGSWLGFFFHPDMGQQLVKLPRKHLTALGLVNKQSYLFFKPILSVRREQNADAMNSIAAQATDNSIKMSNT